MLEIRDWGLRPYPEALAEMRTLRAARRRGEIPDTLLLVEHPPVLTVGVQGADLASLPPGIPILHVERGGHETYHGPGQLVGYPIVDLEARGRNVRGFVGALEALLIEALSEVGVRAGTVAGQRGVWVDGERKIASIGVAVEEWVSFHGFALNVDPDLAVFAAFQPCGLDGRRMTSVARELGRSVPLEELRLPVRRAFLREFGEPTAAVAHASPSPPATA
jgi:lipoate-protein ligase B